MPPPLFVYEMQKKPRETKKLADIDEQRVYTLSPPQGWVYQRGYLL